MQVFWVMILQTPQDVLKKYSLKARKDLRPGLAG